MSDTVQFTENNGLLEIELHRPEKLNSFSREMLLALQDIFSDHAANQNIRAVMIYGAGRAFSAGQDLSEVAPDKDGKLADFGDILRDLYNPVIEAITSLPKPVIAAVNGVAAGAGANLALACDIVFASKSASFIQSFSAVGLIPDSGGTFVLPRLVGWGKACGLMMLGDKLKADEAERIGMIYKVLEDENFIQNIKNIALDLARKPTKGFALTKKLLAESRAQSLVLHLEREAEVQAEAGRSHDYREGVMSFLEKREANFRGE